MKHQKKRNTGLLYEFLARHAAEGLVENDSSKVKKSIKLLKKHFKEGTELHREFRLFKALISTYVESKATASKIVEATRAAAMLYDVTKLDKEKSLLIRNINYTFNDSKFYDKRVDEYKLYATVQVLLNEWRKKVPDDIVTQALYEEDLVEHLTTPKEKNILDEGSDAIVDDLVVRLMSNKINNKYEGVMNNEQLALMNSYVFSLKNNDNSRIVEDIERVRTTTLHAIDEFSKKERDRRITEKLAEIRTLLSDPVKVVDDGALTRYLRIIKLKQEIAEV